MLQPPPLTYRLLSVVLFFFWLLHACWHALKYRQADYILQRLGVFPAIDNNALWLHASSVGEVELVKPLIQALSPSHPVVLTTFTASGFQHAGRIMPPHVLIRVLPIDFYPLSRWFMRRHRFRLGLVAETELWPETLYQAAMQGTRLIRINARLSHKSLQTGRIIRDILQRTLNYFDRHLVRTAADLESLAGMGISHQQVAVCGNLKQAVSETPEQHDDLIGRPYILFASTHAPEEQQFVQLSVSLQLQELLVIAPRHPQRAAEILRALQPYDLNIRQRSRAQPIDRETQLYLADTLGELKALMAHARIVIMGGSFNDTGGHNVMEPARLGRAIITGPSDDNIQADIALLAQHSAILQVADIDELGDKIAELLQQAPLREQLGQNARQAAQQQDRILQDYLEEINAYLVDP